MRTISLPTRLASLNLPGQIAGAFSGGILTVAAQAPLFFWPVLLGVLPAMLWILDGCARAKRPVLRSALVGWVFGFGHFLAGLYWIGEAFLVEADKFAWALPFAVTLLPAGLALFFIPVFLLTNRYSVPGFGRLALFASLWTAGEWLRGHIFTGLPWNLTAYVWGGQDTMMQAASVMGSYSLGLITIFTLSSPAILGWVNLREKAALWALGLAGTLLIAQYSYGLQRTSGQEIKWVSGIQLRLVQPAIAQNIKWNPAYRDQNFSTLLELTRSDNSNATLEGITHVVWPESASPFLLARTPDALELISRALGSDAVLITGQQRAENRADGGFDFFNSVMTITPAGTIEGIYDKVHLVPFGEYLPFRRLLSRLGFRQLVDMRGSGFTPGKGYQVMTASGLPAFVPLICYEILFPGLVPHGPAGDPQWILNVTNDAWFGSSFGPHQHLTASRFRAVEEGLPVIRAANTGISAVIDGYGRLLTRLDINVRGVIDTRLPVSLGRTMFTYVGDAGIAVVVFLLWLLTRLIRTKDT